ncbi:Surfeit locus protein 1 [Vanrija pseudolonga]|uniref:SURF1-like protein n=1 Tax=Vanrija pseudolonga TaxID=143232 RepID=A0AAF0YEH2_9TREE|nr:Surfeit locus protein 1 [Vanrija pseudolonga]
MSRPQSIFSALRSALPRRPLSASPSPVSPFARPRFGFSGPSSHSIRPSSTVTNNSTRSTLLRPITLVLIIAPLLTGYLGVWQVQRLKWKVALIEEVDRNLAKDPIVLPGKINLGALPDFAFRRVLIKGKFSGPPILQGPQTRDGVPGFHLILPFDRSAAGGSTILLNRGFIKTAEGESIRRGGRVPGLGPNGEPSDEVVVEGMLTKADPNAKSYFTPDNKPEKGEWYWKDVPAMAEAVGGEERNVQPILIDAIDRASTPTSVLLAQGEPVGRAPVIELRNQHLTYAITWFSLCAATSAMLAMVIYSGRTKKLPRRSAFGEKNVQRKQ